MITAAIRCRRAAMGAALSVFLFAPNEVKTYMATAGIEIVGSTPAEFAAFFRAERTQWAKVVRETGAKTD